MTQSIITKAEGSKQTYASRPVGGAHCDAWVDLALIYACGRKGIELIYFRFYCGYVNE